MSGNLFSVPQRSREHGPEASCAECAAHPTGKCPDRRLDLVLAYMERTGRMEKRISADGEPQYRQSGSSEWIPLALLQAGHRKEQEEQTA